MFKSKIAVLVGVLAVSGVASADLKTGLVAYYCFDDASNLGKDCSNTGNNGYLEGNIISTKGYKGSAALFGGYNDPADIYIPNSSSLQFNQDFSVAFAVKMTGFDGMDGWGSYSDAGVHAVVAKSHDRNGTTLMVAKGNTQGNVYSFVASYEWNNPIGETALNSNVGKWVHFTYIFSNTQQKVKLYADGVLIATKDGFSQDFTSINSQDLYLGKYSDSWFPLNGSLDEVRIYNRALTKAEVKQLQNSMSLLPDGNIGGDKKGDVPWTFFGDLLDTYIGVEARMNDLDMIGVYQCTDLAFRFAKDALHITKPKKPNGNKFAASNDAKEGYIEVNGIKTNIVTKYYPSGSSTAPINGSIISQNSPTVPKVGHVSIAKKIIKVDDNTLDVYLFEQNWIWTEGKKIAHSRKMTFTKDLSGKWSGKAKGSKALGWLNPEAK